MDLWKKLVQIGQKVLGKEFKNPQEIDKNMLEAITAHVQLIQSIDEQLMVSLLRYLIDDEEDGCLSALSANSAALAKLGYTQSLTGSYADAIEKRGAVVDGGNKAHPEVWYRYGKFLAAAGKGVNAPYVKGRNANRVTLPDWLSALISEISARYTANLRSTNRKAPWSMDELEKVMAVDDLPSDILVFAFLDGGYRTTLLGNPYLYPQYVDCLKGTREYMIRHFDKVRLFLVGSDIENRVYALSFLRHLDFDFSLLSDLLVEYATSSSKTLREAISPLLVSKSEKFRGQIEDVLKNGAASERNEAVALLWRMYESDCAETLKQHALTEKSDRVKQTIEKYLAIPPDQPDVALGVAPMQLDLDPVPLPDKVKKVLKEMLEEAQKAAMVAYEQQLVQFNGPKRPAWMQKPVKPQPVSRDDIDELIEFIEGKKRKFEASKQFGYNISFLPKRIVDCLEPPDVNLAHMIRLMYCLKFIQHHKVQDCERFYLSNALMLDTYREKSNRSFGLREFDAIAATLPDCKPGIVGISYLGGNQAGTFCDWEADAVWPLFAERGELLRDALSETTPIHYYNYGNRRQAFEVLAMFPSLPAEFLITLWELALGETKSERRPAQDALNTVPGKVEKIIVSLGDGKQTVRSAAAEWLGRLGEKSAIEPLKKAFQKEKNEQAKGIIMHALDLLGADVDEFLNRDKLLEEAKAGLTKKMPKGMDWMPLDNFPAVHWKDNGKQVDPQIVKWWVVQSVQQKTPVCGPILKRYLEMCQPTDAAKLARHALTTWIGRDTTTISHEDAVERATAEADQQWAQYSQYQWFSDQYKSKDNLFKFIYSSHMNTCIYSAIDQKGILAIVSASGDADCVKFCEQYIRKYYGNRTAQCKALVDVLAWISHPLALQALLAIANRFRTKSIKELAAEHVKAVAERRGWTIDELADRTIPDGGFERPLDEDGKPTSEQAVLEIDFGPRQFLVTLNDQLEAVICAKGETKALKALPAPVKSDDEGLAKAGKKEFADAKKIAKEVVKRQTERLYEALCTQREWRFQDWQLYLSKHPIVGRLCVRLAWTVFEPSEDQAEQRKLIGAFRPLEDGSLTNEQDEQVTFPNDAIVKLAHSCNMPAELADAWVKHFEDYDVTPLFAQLGRPVYVIPDDKLKDTDVADFVGHLITIFKLRNRAVKLGYVRGEAEDGGCFYVYRKSFASLEMQAVLEFTGSYLPEEDLPAALKELYFVSSSGKDNYTWSMNKIPLSKVPPVLLSECYNDVKRIAADGSGFDPKWQEKSYF
ncbi:MAG: DUF4132 domain-containing protein [Candidatus Melainabacteria bacterium]|nr:DUF4132 domain-containing protein [Candidatus Melainabacteria bacterium]